MSVQQANANLPLFVAKRTTISADNLPDVSTISINVIKKNAESTPIENPHPTTATMPNPFLPPQPAPTAANASTATPKSTISCIAVLDTVRLPDEWVTKQNTEIPAIKIRSENVERTLTQATFMFDGKSGNLFIEAQGFI